MIPVLEPSEVGSFMSSSDLIRWGGLAAINGGVVWVVDALLILAIPESAVTDVLFIIAVLSTVGSLSASTPYRKLTTGA
jgi:hypothetical protein